MKLRSGNIAVSLVLVALCRAGAQDAAPEAPTWEEMTARGIVPYRQLTVDDFPVNDTAYPKERFHIRTAIEPRFRYILKPHTNGFVYAYVDQWMIFAGLNSRETSRKSNFTTMKAELPYVQAMLDINEINARQLGALQPGELPSGRGATPEEAKADMEAKLKQLLEKKYQQNQTEMNALAKATNFGQSKKKLRELAADIRKRLEATPPATVPFTVPATAGTSPAASASTTPSTTISPSPAPTPPR